MIGNSYNQNIDIVTDIDQGIVLNLYYVQHNQLYFLCLFEIQPRRIRISIYGV